MRTLESLELFGRGTARTRARLPGVEVLLLRHVAVWKVVETLGLATLVEIEAVGEDSAALNRAGFEG